MPDLHDQYQTLIRRGMPSRSMLAWVPYAAPTDGNKGYWILDGSDILEIDARDLITMHAMRWIGQVIPEIDVIEYRGAGTVILDISTRIMGANATILEAIVDATETLEPVDA